MLWLEASSGMWVAMGAAWKATILLSALAVQTLFPLLATYAIEASRRRWRRDARQTAASCVWSEGTILREVQEQLPLATDSAGAGLSSLRARRAATAWHNGAPGRP
jgi:hypothetical protein